MPRLPALSGQAPGPPVLLDEPAAAVRYQLQSLTGLRFVAALAVFMSHMGIPQGSPERLITTFVSGYAGVTLFFVLSGFVLALNYTGKLSTGAQLWSYTVARVARLYPLYLAVLAYAIVLAWSKLGELPDNWVEYLLGLQAWNADVNVTFGLVGPAWSVGVEAFLYLTLPVLALGLRLVDRSTRSLLVAGAVVVVTLLLLTYGFDSSGRGDLPVTDPDSAHRWLYHTPLTRIGDFLLGILAARLYVRVRGQGWTTPLGLGLTVSGALIAVVLAGQSSLQGTAWSWDVMYALPSVAVILGLALAPRQPLARLLALPALVLLGEASYAFYLVHKQIIDTVPEPRDWTLEFTWATAGLGLAQLALAVVLSIGLHVALERPARHRVRWLLDPAYRRSAAGGAAPG